MASTHHLMQAIHGINDPAMKVLWSDLVDDLTALRTQLIAALVKLDDDGGVTDTDYEATLTPAALKTKK